MTHKTAKGVSDKRVHMWCRWWRCAEKAVFCNHMTDNVATRRSLSQTAPHSPRSRWMLGTKEFTKNIKMTTLRTDTHFTRSTLSVILCCWGKARMDVVCVSLWRVGGTGSETHLLLQFLDVLLPVFILLRNLSVENHKQSIKALICRYFRKPRD